MAPTSADLQGGENELRLVPLGGADVLLDALRTVQRDSPCAGVVELSQHAATISSGTVDTAQVATARLDPPLTVCTSPYIPVADTVIDTVADTVIDTVADTIVII